MKKLKKIIALLIVLLLSAAAVVMVALWEEEAEPGEIIKVNRYEGEEKTFVLENEALLFELDYETTQFKVTVKETGQVWYSNPQEVEADAIAHAGEKDKLRSTLLLTYSNINGVDTLQNNYAYSIENQIFQIEEGNEYIRVDYSIGDVEKEYTIPAVMEEERMNAVFELVSKSDKTTIMDYYKKYDLNNLGKKDNKEELLERYPSLEQGVIYALRDTTKENMKKRLEGIFTEAGYTYEEYLMDKEKDKAVKTSDKPVFNISMIYRLEGDELVVEVPFDEIEYKEDYPVYNLSVLPYFGAAGTSEEGFLLVPEGGGGLINFNNGKLAQSSYYADVYGWDMALDRDAIVHETETCFNVFGEAKADAAFLCILEDGAPYASIRADISGRSNSYNYVNAVYSMIHREQYDVSDKYRGNMYVYEQGLATGEKILQRYCFVDSADYVDMAKTYQEYLLTKYAGVLEQVTDTQAPVEIEIVGAVDKIGQVFGVPVSKPLELTTYKEAGAVIAELRREGLKNMSVKLTGWANDGVQQKILTKVTPVKELGSKTELKELIRQAKELDIKFYLDGVTSYANDSDILDGFFVFTDAARFVSKDKAELFQYSTVTYSKREGQNTFYLLNPEMMQEMVDNLSVAAESYGAGVSFREIGDELSSDFNKKKTVTRQMAMNNQITQLKELSDAGISLMVNAGNDYALPYVDMITDMNLKGSGYGIIDKEVPFYQLAIHGLVNYAGEALNLAQNEEEELLKSVEYGAGLAFVVMDESAFTLQNTLYTQYFGAEYDEWKEQIIEIYTRYNEELGHVFNQKMVNHEYLEDTLTCTTYADGTKVYVNFAYKEVVIGDGLTVPARDYVVIR